MNIQPAWRTGAGWQNADEVRSRLEVRTRHKVTAHGRSIIVLLSRLHSLSSGRRLRLGLPVLSVIKELKGLSKRYIPLP